MRSTRSRFIIVALLVCFFAIAMATFLNYFKYRSTVAEVVKTRVLYVADGIEDNVAASLALGLPFAEMPTIQALIQRERTTDDLIAGIELFDPAGQIIYATEKAKIGKQAAMDWLTEATQQRRDRGRPVSWTTAQNDEQIVALALRNNFDLTVGYLTLRYPQQYVETASNKMGWELIKIAVAVFVVCALLSGFLLTVIIRRFEKDMDSLAETLQEAGAPIVADATASLPDGLGESLEAYNLKVQSAQNQINVVRKHLRAAMAVPDTADATINVSADAAFETTLKLTPVSTAPIQSQPES